MKTIERKNCIVCNQSLEHLHTIPSFPIFMGTTLKDQTTDLTANKFIKKCKSCGAVQMGNLIPLEILYKDEHNSAIGKTWERHHNEFCDFVSKYVSGDVLEIGGGNLIVAKRLAELDKVNKVTVFDTNVLKYTTEISKKIKPVRDFFKVDKVKEKVNIIIHTHLIEHLYNPMEEMPEITSILDDGSYMCFAAPMIDKMLKDKFTNAFNFEHTYVLSYKMMEDILTKSNMEIVDTKYFSPHALFVVARKNSKIKTLPDNFSYSDQEFIMNDFVDYYMEEVKKIKSLLTDQKENTFIFGAHIFTQYLLKFGLKENHFNSILDNDPNKIGERLYGTSLAVQSPKMLSNLESPLVVLKAAQYTEEIKKDILENINSNTRFIL